MCFVVDDAFAIYERVVQHQVEVFSPPVEVDTGVNKGGFALYVKDPDGITVELFQRTKVHA